MSVRRGDAYAYAAAPHVVHPLAGLRRTLVVALNTAADDDRAEYFREAEERHRPRRRRARHEPLHLLRGEFLEALGRADDAKRAFCASYRATDDAGAYARRFLADGRDAAVADRMDVANEYFRMARCIEPDSSLTTPRRRARRRRRRDAAVRGARRRRARRVRRAESRRRCRVARATPPGGGRRRAAGGRASVADLSSPSATSIAACIVPNHADGRGAARRERRCKLNFTSSRRASAASPLDEPQRHSSTPASD